MTIKELQKNQLEEFKKKYQFIDAISKKWKKCLNSRDGSGDGQQKCIYDFDEFIDKLKEENEIKI